MCGSKLAAHQERTLGLSGVHLGGPITAVSTPSSAKTSLSAGPLSVRKSCSWPRLSTTRHQRRLRRKDWISLAGLLWASLRRGDLYFVVMARSRKTESACVR